MSEQQDNPDNGYLDRVSEDLAMSLRRCHALVDDCRGKLAANSNEPNAANELDAREEEDDERVG